MSTGNDDWLDALFDLKHDLGKYLLLPVAWLPADASATDLCQAVEQALLRTREGPDGPKSAAALWQAFLDEVGDGLSTRPGWAELDAAIERALAWQHRLEEPLDRALVQEDLAEVGRAIAALIEELTNDD